MQERTDPPHIVRRIRTLASMTEARIRGMEADDRVAEDKVDWADVEVAGMIHATIPTSSISTLR